MTEDESVVGLIRGGLWALFATASLNRQPVVTAWEVRKGATRLPGTSPAEEARLKVETVVAEADLLLVAFNARFPLEALLLDEPGGA